MYYSITFIFPRLLKIYRHNRLTFSKETREDLLGQNVALKNLKKVLGLDAEFSVGKNLRFEQHQDFYMEGNAYARFMLLLFIRGHSKNKKYDFVALHSLYGLFLSRTYVTRSLESLKQNRICQCGNFPF